MYLKEIYISGFKSFARPTTLSFDQQISAIVGPNGSGKSNISDALRFVLGEQRTKQMRSQKMEDIIFSGTSTEKARGAAEVRLILEESEGSDLIITRKLFRTGESVYQINGKKVRLKDIHDLFADTGLGKNGYSIVSQGGVENIIGANPNELREMVEEAVGIAGYKAKRNETQSRLRQTQENINRINDILEEVEKQKKTLKVQADKTRRYLEINEILRIIDLVSFFHEQTKNINELAYIQKSLEVSQNLISDLDTKSQRLEENYTRQREDLKALQKKLESIRSLLNAKQEELYDKREERTVKKQNCEFTKKEIATLNQKIEDDYSATIQLKKSLTDVLEQIKKIQSNFNDLEQIYLKEKDKFKKLEEEYNLVNEKRLSSQKQISVNQMTMRNLSQELLEKESSYNQLKVETGNLEKTLSEAKNREASILSSIKNLREQSRDLKIELQNQEKEQKKREDQKSLLQHQSESYLENKKHLETSLTKLNSQLTYQIQLKENYSGYQNSVRAIMQYAQKKHMKDVIGPVAELYSTKSQYSLAIQVAIGARSQNIIVENERTAQKLIQYLKSSKKGRATFLPLDSVRAKKMPINIINKIHSQPGYIGIASELIETNPKLRIIFDQLLSHTVVIDTFENASLFRKKFGQYTLVTLGGEIFYANGAIVGGTSPKDTQTFLNRSNEIHSLEKEIEKEKENLENLDNNQKSIRQQLNKLLNDLSIRELELRKKRQKLVELNEKFNYQQRELKQIQTTIEEVQHSLDKKTLKDYEKDIERIREKITELNNFEVPEENSQELDHAGLLIQSEVVSSKKIELEGLKLKIDSLTEKKENLKREIDQKEIQLRNTRCSLEISKKELAETLETIEHLNNEINQLKKEVSEKDKLYNKFNQDAKDLDDRLIKIETELRDVQHQRNLEIENKSGFERKEERLKINRKNLNDYIYENYSVNYALVKDEIGSLEKKKPDLSKREIESLRAERKKIGNISTDSISNYAEVKKRYHELKKQYDDLIIAEGNILKTIEQINTSMVEELSIKFNELNQSFNRIFSTLFEGGKAHLNFVDSRDILNSGIELAVQPPGKNLKSLNLLSGGEKAMTAIALLLSFIELNPSPFIIIDEIDAALDDSNIARFTSYLKEICEKNQFIIITHRKSTLGVCNRINGVTMNSSGVSKLCTLELSEYFEG